MYKAFLFILFLFISCNSTEDINSDSHDNSSVLIALQDSDYVAIVSSYDLEVTQQVNIDFSNTNCSDFSTQMECEMSGCMWHIMDNDMAHCMNMDMGGDNAPHDIAVDNTNDYWFTTAMMGGDVGMYSTETNEFISSFTIGHMPALMTLDEVNMLIYISRGMPNGMLMPIYELSYESGELVEVEQWDVNFDYAHGIYFDEISGNVYTVSKTNDFIAKIDPNAAQEPFNNPMLVSMDESINTSWDISVNRLRPIHITAKYPYMFITCSAGEWSADEEYEEIPGQVQMWHMEDMNLLATYNFDLYSRPWHIDISPIENKFYVALSGGDGSNGSSNSGVACIEYSETDDNQYSMSESWITTSSEYGTLHGMTVHSDCDGNYHVYSAGRTDGNIYKFDANTGEQLGSTNLVLSGSLRTGGIDSLNPPCDESCCD